MCLDKATFPVWLSLSYVFYMLKWQISNHYQKGQSKSVKAHIWGFQWLLIRAPACLKMPGSHCIYITDELWDCTINITLWWMMLVARKQIEFTSVFSRCSIVGRGGQKKVDFPPRQFELYKKAEWWPSKRGNWLKLQIDG